MNSNTRLLGRQQHLNEQQHMVDDGDNVKMPIKCAVKIVDGAKCLIRCCTCCCSLGLHAAPHFIAFTPKNFSTPVPVSAEGFSAAFWEAWSTAFSTVFSFLSDPRGGGGRGGGAEVVADEEEEEAEIDSWAA